MRRVAIAALLLAAACGQRGVTWEKPGATQADIDRDNYECQKDAYGMGGAAYMGFDVTLQ
jgi:hypothetical protein